MIPFLLTATIRQTPAEFDAEKLANLGSRMEKMTKQGFAAGAVMIVRHNGQTVWKRAVGKADLETGAAMKEDTVFQVMSMTKPITAAAVMLCVEDGLLGLDDPAEEYLPSLKGVKVKKPNGTLVSADRKILIRHLLSHTSGLASDDPGGLSDEAKAKLTLSAYSNLIGTEPLLGHPGGQIRYSGVGMSTLAAIVEKVSGQPFEKYCQVRIFDLLEMKDTSFFVRPDQRGRLAQVYSGDIGSLKPFAHDRFREGAKFPNGAGGLYSTAADMANFIEAFVKPRSQFLSPASIWAMTHVQSGDLEMDGGRARGFGLGFSVNRAVEAGGTLRPIGSFGHTGAFGTEYWADPATGVVAVFMAQTFLVPETMRKRFTTMVWAAKN